MEALTPAVLSFLAADTERFERFLALTGLDVGSLRAATRSTVFGESLWGYLGSDEPLLLAFAAEQAMSPEDVAGLVHFAAAPPFAD